MYSHVITNNTWCTACTEIYDKSPYITSHIWFQ